MNLTLFNWAIVAYFASTVAYGLYLVTRRGGPGVAGSVLLAAGLVLHGCVIGQRWVLAGRPPFVSLFEVLMFFSWCIVLAYLAIETAYRERRVGMLVAFIGLLSLGYAGLLDKTIEPLVAALQSPWLTIHVMACFVGYAAFCVSYVMALVHIGSSRKASGKAAVFLLALSLLAATAVLLKKHMELGDTALAWVALGSGAVLGSGIVTVAVSLIRRGRGGAWERGEQLVRKAVAFGYPFLTIGIITGGVWANQAWGRYWGWDSKETWSLVTWIIYTVYLHGLRALGWRGQRASWVAVVGFLAVMFTWLGVNYVLSGLHSYG